MLSAGARSESRKKCLLEARSQKHTTVSVSTSPRKSLTVTAVENPHQATAAESCILVGQSAFLFGHVFPQGHRFPGPSEFVISGFFDFFAVHMAWPDVSRQSRQSCAKARWPSMGTKCTGTPFLPYPTLSFQRSVRASRVSSVVNWVTKQKVRTC